MANSTTMQYGGYSFIPVPFITLTRNHQRTADGTLLGNAYIMTLQGTLTPLPDNGGSIISIDTLQDALLSAFANDGQAFSVQCNSTTLVTGNPIVNNVNLSPSPDNWVNTSPFTIELEFSSLGGETAPFISSAAESWNVEAVEEQAAYSIDLSAVDDPPGGDNLDANPYVLRMTHNISAVGKEHYSAGGLDRQGWQEAQAYVTGLLGFDNTFLGGSNFSEFNHLRSQQVDELGGSFSVTETWLILKTGIAGTPDDGLEDFNINVIKTLDNSITTVDVNGTIQGVETRTYNIDPGDFSITTNKYDAAVSYWAAVQGRLLARAQFAADGIADRSISSTIVNQTVGHSPSRGAINYSYSYDDRPSNCIAGSLSEIITVNDINPTDIFAQLVVLGRAAGPVLQDISTTTPSSREVTVELVMPPSTGCTVALLMAGSPSSAVDTLMADFEADISETYDTFFKNNDQESWNAKMGRYSRSTAWIFTNC